MFCHITENWRGRPLVSREVVVNLIGHTTTKQGLSIRSELDRTATRWAGRSPPSRWRACASRTDKFHGEWNYTILPRVIN